MVLTVYLLFSVAVHGHRSALCHIPQGGVNILWSLQYIDLFRGEPVKRAAVSFLKKYGIMSIRNAGKKDEMNPV